MCHLSYYFYVHHISFKQEIFLDSGFDLENINVLVVLGGCFSCISDIVYLSLAT